MKKFYIPTSTLNFNNILSSESISPKAFYERRGFGYKRWVSVKENDNENCVLLYENFCYFDIPTSEQEDHPMLVEIDAEERDFQPYADGVWYSDKTVYLDPWHTHFVFFSDSEKRITFSLSDSSLETKLVKLYTRYSRVEKPQDTYCVPEKKDIHLNEVEIEKDFRLNKMKGLLYGYYIGALLSSSKDYVEKLTDLKEIRNIFSAILSSPEHNMTEFQEKSLERLFEKIKQSEPEYLARKVQEQELFKRLKDIAPDKGMENYRPIFEFCFPDDIVLSYDKKQLISSLKSDWENNPSLDWINRRIATQEKQHNMMFLSPQAQEVMVEGNEVVDISLIENLEGKRLFQEWCNNVFSDNKYDGNISTFNLELATKIALKAKDIYQDNWNDNNPVRVFLNKLRKHIAGEVFDVKWDNNGLLYSVAAVLISGDDWNKLLLFMQDKSMFDYRLAFAIYGELNGFANLPRDFSDILFECKSEYISEVYKEFYKQLFGKELNGYLEIPQPQPQPLQQLPLQVEPEPKIVKSLAERVDEIIAAHPKVKISEKELTAINKAKKLPLTDDEDFIKLIDNDMESLSKTTGIFHFLQEEFFPEYEYPSKAKSPKKEKGVLQKGIDSVKNLFSSNSSIEGKNVLPDGQIFYCDKNVWYHIEPLITDKDIKSKISADIRWIQDAYQKRGYAKKDGSWVKCEDTDNKNVIYHFYNIVKKKYDTKLVDSIVNKLKELYNVK